MIQSRMILAVVALAAASAASAAEDSPEPRRSDIAALESFSACVVDRARDDAELLLQGDFREDAYDEAMVRLARKHSRCLGPLGGELRAAGVLFAGAIAESLLQEDMTQAELASSLRPTQPPIEARSAGEYTALCMALKHPVETSALLFSDGLEPRSDALLTAYASNLPQCVQPGGEFRINKPGLRAIIALAAYRLSQSNRTSGEG